MIKYLAEFLGTFIFLSIILHATAKNAIWPSLTPLLIVCGLLVGIVVSANISGGHLNPAVSIMMFLDKSLPSSELVPYIGSQILGAIAAKSIFDLMQKQY